MNQPEKIQVTEQMKQKPPKPQQMASSKSNSNSTDALATQHLHLTSITGDPYFNNKDRLNSSDN